MKKKSEAQCTFQLKSIELLDTCMNAPSKPLGPETLFNFDISLEHRIDPAQDILAVVSTILVYTESRDEILGKLRAGCVYQIADLKRFVNPETKEYKLPEPVTTALNSISISTARGLMFSAFRGTFLHAAILPIVDPTKFNIQKPVITG